MWLHMRCSYFSLLLDVPKDCLNWAPPSSGGKHHCFVYLKKIWIVRSLMILVVMERVVVVPFALDYSSNTPEKQDTTQELLCQMCFLFSCTCIRVVILMMENDTSCIV